MITKPFLCVCLGRLTNRKIELTPYLCSQRYTKHKYEHKMITFIVIKSNRK